MDAGSSSSSELPQPFRQFTISEIQSATENFDESLVIGRGGFGKVYKGTISNLVVAIKRLDSTSNQGAAEFFAEVHMLSKLRHCHLVSLIGCCNDGQEMILVYEYMPHGTLEGHLHEFQRPITWVRRLKICIGAARGLDYLHTGTGTKHGVIHRDVKSSNILLDDSWDAKISDFGLSKLGPINQPSTYVNTFVKGTFGYLDPDYYATGRLTRKSDVYAFGVVLLEVLSGKQAVDSSLDEEHWGLVNWAQESMKEGRLKQIVDCDIRDRILPKCLKEFGRLADRCVDSNPKKRPTMADVVVCLESILAIQEKANHTGIRIFGNKVPMFLSSSNGENSVGSKRLTPLELYFDTVGGEDSITQGRLQDGKGVSIASYNSESESQDYKNEVSLLVKLEHKNLLPLLGYSIKGTQVFLVYQPATYSNLDCLINDPECTILDWDKRYKIILGVARALLYLHQHGPFQIIHRDVEPRNILLDESLDPKLSNLGIARCLANNDVDCVIEERLRGTMEYTAPEYLYALHLSTKADVYSLGVLLLGTIMGYTKSFYIYNDKDMPFGQYVWKNCLEGTSSAIIDPRIHADSSSITRVIHIGLLCVQEDPTDRPTMEEVVGMLTNTLCLAFPIPKIHTRPWLIEIDSFEDSVVSDDSDSREVENFDSGAVEDFISELCPR